MKKVKMKKAWIAIACVVGSGCAFTPQSVRITPELKLSSSLNGAGKAVKVTVVDERPSKTLGQRGASNMGADLTVAGELSDIFQSTLKTGLEKQGFRISDNEFSSLNVENRNLGATGPSTLKVEIRSLDYKLIAGFLSGTLRTECAVKAFCKSGSGKEYEKLYNGLYEQTALAVATAEGNNQYVSASVSDALNKLLSDSELGRCLAE